MHKKVLHSASVVMALVMAFALMALSFHATQMEIAKANNTGNVVAAR